MGVLDGKVAVVTGATKGIGAGLARHFAQEGARVVGAGRDEERGARLVDDVTSAGGEASFIRTDIGVESDVEAMITHALGTFGGLDILVNNAAPTDISATGADGPVAERTNDGFEAMLKVGVWGLFWCCKYAVQAMVQDGGGSIVNISSVASTVGVPGTTIYATCKGAMNALTRSIAVDYGPAQVRANALVVGTVPANDLVRFLHDHPVAGPALIGLNALPRAGRPDDVAKAAAFLASDAGDWITGALIPVDGGFTAKAPVPDLSEVLKEFDPSTYYDQSKREW
jgi:NAD(P)-dependent dehydrogenase (short-subunit alcohol dehydrogenase family)